VIAGQIPNVVYLFSAMLMAPLAVYWLYTGLRDKHRGAHFFEDADNDETRKRRSRRLVRKFDRTKRWRRAW
jgi:hypothetical protein